MNILPASPDFASMLGESLGGGFASGFKQGRESSIVQQVLQDMEDLDPSQFAQRIAQAEGEVSDNPVALSNLQRATTRYEELRQDRIIRDLLADEKYLDSDYKGRVDMAIKQGVPAQRAIGLANDVQQGEIGQQKVVTPYQRMVNGAKEQMAQAAQFAKNAQTQEDREKYMLDYEAIKNGLEEAKRVWKEVEKKVPDYFKRNPDVDMVELLDPEFINNAEASAKQAQPNQPEQPGQRLTEGLSGAPQVSNEHLSKLSSLIGDLGALLRTPENPKKSVQENRRPSSLADLEESTLNRRAQDRQRQIAKEAEAERQKSLFREQRKKENAEFQGSIEKPDWYQDLLRNL